MEEIEKKAREMPEPTKYAHHEEWKEKDRTYTSHKFGQVKRLTGADEFLVAKKGIPAPNKYLNATGLKPKVPGFYNKTEDKCSILRSTAFEK